MKHLLNDLSEEEKNRIREQHTGGKKIMIENFNQLLNKKLGEVKPLINEQDVPCQNPENYKPTPIWTNFANEMSKLGYTQDMDKESICGSNQKTPELYLIKDGEFQMNFIEIMGRGSSVSIQRQLKQDIEDNDENGIFGNNFLLIELSPEQLQKKFNDIITILKSR
jgi:hypothetical protein